MMTLMGVQQNDRGRHLLVRFTDGGCIVQGVMERHDVGEILMVSKPVQKLPTPAFVSYKGLD